MKLNVVLKASLPDGDSFEIHGLDIDPDEKEFVIELKKLFAKKELVKKTSREMQDEKTKAQ